MGMRGALTVIMRVLSMMVFVMMIVVMLVMMPVPVIMTFDPALTFATSTYCTHHAISSSEVSNFSLLILPALFYRDP